MTRRALCLAATLAAILTLPQQALAAGDFFASASGTGDCASPSSPCALDVASKKASMTSGGANVHVLGALTWPAPLTLTPNAEVGWGTNPVHLLGSGAGSGGTLIDGGTSPALTLQNGSTAQDVHVTSSNSSQTALLQFGSAITNSFVENTDSGNAVKTAVGGASTTALLAGDRLTAGDAAVDDESGGGSNSLEVRDSVLNGHAGIFDSTGTPVTVQRSTISASNSGIRLVGAGGGFVSSSVIHMTGNGTVGVHVGSPSSEAGMALIESTIDGGDTTGASHGVEADAHAPVTSTPNSVEMLASIVRGFGTDLVGITGGGGDVAGNVAAARSDYGSAAGGVSTGPGNVNVDPLFANRAGGDYRLLAGSPVIDAAGTDPIEAIAAESPTDRAGNPRILDGNGDGFAARDMGAFEFVFMPPAPLLGGGPLPHAGGLPRTPFRLRGRKLVIAGRVIKVPAACDRSAPIACQIQVTVRSTAPLMQRRIAAAKKKRRKILTFGSGRGTIQPGRSGAIKVRLTTKALRQLKRNKVKKVRVSANTVAGVAAAARTSHVYAISFAPARKKKH